MEDETRALRRKLLVYRALLGLVVVAAAGALVLTRRRAPPDVEVFDVAAQVDELGRAHPGWADVVPEPYFATNAATVHLHVMSPHQLCPLHLHESTEEATVVVKGVADTEHVFGPELTVAAGHRPPGTVVISPPYSGHAWRNAGDVPLGNLVFTAPRFVGNRYVDRDEPLLRRGGAPIVIDLERELGATGPRRETPLPFAGGRLRLVVTDVEERIDPRDDATLVYDLRGAGRLEGAPIAPGRLVVLRGRRAAQLVPDAGVRLAVLVFQPAAP